MISNCIFDNNSLTQNVVYMYFIIINLIFLDLSSKLSDTIYIYIFHIVFNNK